MNEVIPFIFMISTILASLGLIVIIYSRNADKYTSNLFILILILVIAYVIAHGMHFHMLSTSVKEVTILDKSCHSLLLLIIITLTFFSISFVNKQKVGVITSLLILIPSIILLYMLWTGNLVYESHVHLDQFKAHYDPKYPLFLAWYLVLIFYVSFVLIRKYIKEENHQIKKQILILFFGLLLTNLTSFVFGLFLPWILGFYYLVEISPLAFLAGLILFTTIGVGKYNMFPNVLDKVNSFSLSKKIFLIALIAVPLVIIIIQIPLGRVLFGIETPDAWTRYFLMTLLGGIIVSVTISFIVLKVILSPIEKLKNQALEIQKGNFGIVVDINSNDEIGELAYAFNEMTNTLKKDVEEIKQKEYRITMLLDAFDKSFTSIALVDSSFKIMQANNMFCKINSVDKNEIVNKSIDEIHFKGILEKKFHTIKQELQKNNTYEGELIFQGNDDHLKTFLISVTQFDLSGIEKKGFLFVEVDITRLKKLESQLAKAEKLAAIGKMGAILAHEVKTPLTSIKMNADILSNTLVLNDDDKQSFAIINKEINRLNNLVKEILQFSRQSELNYTTFNIIDILRAIEKNNSNKFLTKKFVIFINMDDFKITADWEKLYQAFLNIVENSFESSQDGGYIKFESTIYKNKVVIIVTDNGKGIPQGIRERIFEPFYTSKSSGTGLGLSICQKIIEQHNGAIALLSSEVGRTIFEITLPSVP
ncbi:Nitrogen regulation protein NtrB [hydrothermal vent metagenome]|uniref:histidine kinase n=1 Tax=hydrothermal vent metagenome TaxID=652676 RepID=A0A3B1D6Q5_9ZZZZ